MACLYLDLLDNPVSRAGERLAMLVADKLYSLICASGRLCGECQQAVTQSGRGQNHVCSNTDVGEQITALCLVGLGTCFHNRADSGSP
jgi:hypothetical protein